MILKFDGWPWKTIGNIFSTISSFVHHFIAISELKLELQSGNIQFGSKSASFFPVWPWNLTHWSLTVLAEQRPKAICQPAARTVKSYAVLISPWMLASNGTVAHSYCHQSCIFFPNIYQISWYLSVFFVKIWMQMASNNIKTQTMINKILTYFCYDLRVASQINASTPRCLCPYFCLNLMAIQSKTNILMFFILVICFNHCKNNIWSVKSLAFHTGSGTKDVVSQLRLSRLIYARSARSVSVFPVSTNSR